MPRLTDVHEGEKHVIGNLQIAHCSKGNSEKWIESYLIQGLLVLTQHVTILTLADGRFTTPYPIRGASNVFCNAVPL